MDMYKTDDYFGYLLNKNQQFKPGTNFCYNNGLSLMLGHIIEQASGLRADSFARQYLFDFLKAAGYSWDIDRNGITRMDGGLKMRPRDMLSFGSLYLNNGQWNGEQILSEDWVKSSTTQKVNLNDRGYASHWWTMDYTINGNTFRTYYALGHGEQAIIVVPGSDLVFVMTAGNYMQVEHRPFEIMSQYILPSLETGL
jgi:CubicO group peptidase (beta-lactamase class C family)